MSAYIFEKPLIRGTMLKRKSQFTALVDIDGEKLIAHIPTTNRFGDVENKNLPCLLSYHDDPKCKLKYDIEAVLLSDDDNCRYFQTGWLSTFQRAPIPTFAY